MLSRRSAGVVPLSIALITSTLAFPGSLYAQSESHKNVSTARAGRNRAPAPKGRANPEKKQNAPLVEKFLIEGKLEAGETALLGQLKVHPADDQLRFGLGCLQFLRAVEKLSQALNRYGLGNGTLRRFDQLPYSSLPLTPNSQPQALSYQGAQDIARVFLQDLSKAEATLAAITAPDVKLPLHFGMIRLDLNGDGQIAEDESLWKLYAALDRTKNISADAAQDFYICFDRGDVHWLRGYCHVLMGACELYLAHDTKETFDCTAHLFFNKVDSPYKFLAESNPQLHNQGDILDLIALVHLINWPVAEPERMMSALHHFEDVTKQSKESWKWIMAEKDDDHEWLPNPQQTGVIPNVRVSQEMIDTWVGLMDQSAKILAGERLLAFWRGSDGYGINMRKMFTEAKTFDLVLFIQGPGAAPYLEKGELVETGTLAKLQHAFGSQFPGFVVWFN